MNAPGKSKLVAIGNYTLLGSNLGKGTFGRVELGCHRILKSGPKVALKIVLKSLTKDPYVLKNLNREAYILAKIHHPNIVAFIELVSLNDVHCLVLEQVVGETLQSYVRKHGPLTESDASFKAKQIIDAIDYLHSKRILHRDLKLENIMVEDQRVVIIDFGLSNYWYPGKHMLTHCGSAEYAPPELFDRTKNYGTGVDVWSFGIILYSMVLKSLPFQIEACKDASENPMHDLVNQISRGLVAKHHKKMLHLSIDCRAILLQCLEVDDRSRATVSRIVGDCWIAQANAKQIAKPARPDPIVLAAELKRRLGISATAEHIASYAMEHRFGTTAGFCNLIALEMEGSKSFRNNSDEVETSARIAQKKPRIVETNETPVESALNKPSTACQSKVRRSASEIKATRSRSRPGVESPQCCGALPKDTDPTNSRKFPMRPLGQRALVDIANRLRLPS